MKTSFATLAAVLVMLCTTSTALAETPTPSGDAPSVVPQLYYSEMRSNVVAAQIISWPGNATIMESWDIKFQIHFIGTPEPTMVVFFAGGLINYNKKAPSGRDKYKITCVNGLCTFIVNEVEPEDSGAYKFEAINAGGTDAVSARVLVTEIIR